MHAPAKVAVLGASGYIGGEALRLLLGHPCVEVAAVTSSSNARQPVTSVHPHLAKLTSLTFRAELDEEEASDYDAIFMALPHGHAMEQAPRMLNVGGKGGPHGDGPLLLDMSGHLPASEYAAAHLERLAFCGRLARMFDTVDVFACPTVGVRVPADVSVMDPDAIPIWLKAMRFTAPFNCSGSPTISVPCGFSPDGVPIGLQLVGRHFEEAIVIRAAAAYEAATEWHLRHPRLGD